MRRGLLFLPPHSKITSLYSLIGSGFQMEIRAFSSAGKISHQLHSDLTPTSTHFRTFIPQGGNAPPDKGGSDYVFRYGMVLVAFDCCSAGNLHPVQGKVYEMVEQTGTGEEKEPDRKMG